MFSRLGPQKVTHWVKSKELSCTIVGKDDYKLTYINPTKMEYFKADLLLYNYCSIKKNTHSIKNLGNSITFSFLNIKPSYF